MRRLMMVLTVPMLVMGLAACGSGSSTSSGGSGSTTTKSGTSAALTGTVNTKSSADVSDKADAKLEVEADDFYFKPTYVRGKPGQTITVELHNEGTAKHTFTVSALDIDVQLAPDGKEDVAVTLPDRPGLVEFHCDFHSAMGMRGAFVVGSGTAAGAGSGSSTTTTGSSGY